MFFGNSEIVSIENGIATTKDGGSIELTEKNKTLLTEEAKSGSDLQYRWTLAVTEEVFSVFSKIKYFEWDKEQMDACRRECIIDVLNILSDHNMRITDIELLFQFLESEIKQLGSQVLSSIESKENERLINVYWKDKLDDVARAFGAKDDVPDVSVRSIRIKDLFNT